MPFTENYGRLLMALSRQETAAIVAIDGNPYTVNPLDASFILVAKLGLGTDGSQFFPTQTELIAKLTDDVVTESAITVSDSEVFQNVSIAYSDVASHVIKESAVYALCNDVGATLRQIMIRRDLLTPPFTTNPSTSYTNNYKQSQSLLI